MTDTTDTVENNEPAQTTGAQPQPPCGVIEHLDPATLRLGENVRDSIDLGKEFLASVREHGVLVPITAVRGDDGVITVRNGQRRTVAAREIGLPTVPVYVLAATTADTAAETIDRIAHQIVTNDQKRDLSEAQRARGMQQMIEAGLSTAKVARKLSVTRATVNAAEAVGRSPGGHGRAGQRPANSGRGGHAQRV